MSPAVSLPLYSRKLHMRVLRASTSCETSLMIFALSLGESVVNHFASRCMPYSHQHVQAVQETSHIPLYPAARAG